jgi:hypothetical protein
MIDNPWATVADRQIVSPVKARQRASEQRVAAQKECAVLRKAWSAWRRERIAALIGRPYGEAAQTLCELLDDMTIGDGAALVAAIRTGPWRDANPDTRHEVIAMVDRAIMRLRERNGLPPLDDAMPFSDEPPTAFQIVREALR